MFGCKFDINEKFKLKSWYNNLLYVFKNNFSELIKVNIIFFFLNLPAFFYIYYLSNLIVIIFSSNSIIYNFLHYSISMLLICIPVISVGPFQAAFTYIIQKIIFSETVYKFRLEDFIKSAVKHLKQGIFMMLIDIIILSVIFVDLYAYLLIIHNAIFLYHIIAICIAFILLIYVFMHIYIYPQMIYGELNLFQIIRNSFIFSIKNFFKNLVLFVALFIFILAINIIPYLNFAILMFLLYALFSCIINFYAGSEIKNIFIKIGGDFEMEMKKIQEERNKMEREKELIEQEKIRINEEVQKLMQEKHHLEEEKKYVKEEKEKIEVLKQELERKKLKIEEELSKLENERNSIKQVFENLEGQIDEFEEKIIELAVKGKEDEAIKNIEEKKETVKNLKNEFNNMIKNDDKAESE